MEVWKRGNSKHLIVLYTYRVADAKSANLREAAAKRLIKLKMYVCSGTLLQDVLEQKKKNSNKIKNRYFIAVHDTKMCYIVNVFRYELFPHYISTAYSHNARMLIESLFEIARFVVKLFTVSRPHRLRSSRWVHIVQTNNYCLLQIDGVNSCFKKNFINNINILIKAHKVNNNSRKIIQFDNKTIRSSTILFPISKLLRLQV